VEAVMPILLVLILIWLFSTLINLIVIMRFTYKHIDTIEQYLTDCDGIVNTRSLWGGGVWGRHMRLSMIFAAMYMPGIMFRRGYITENAHLNIPLHIRQRIWAINIWLLINCTCMAVLYYSVKSR
jgi:hypothetical protein